MPLLRVSRGTGVPPALKNYEQALMLGDDAKNTEQAGNRS